jgi:hypothetical protein
VHKRGAALDVDQSFDYDAVTASMQAEAVR